MINHGLEIDSDFQIDFTGEPNNYDFLYQPRKLTKKDVTIEVPAGGNLTDLGIRRDIQLLTHLYGFFILRTHENDALLDNRRFKEWRNQLHLLLGKQVRQPYSNAGKKESQENAVARKVLADYGVDFRENDILMMANPDDRVKGNKYNGHQEVHQDSTFLKVVPNWVVFTVLQNAPSGGETRVASGQHLLNAIPLPYLAVLKEADAVTFFREGTDGHLSKSIINYYKEKRCITMGYRADGDVEYKCKSALTQIAMNWIWNFNKEPDNYTYFLLEELRESLVLANLVAFHGREGFTNSEAQIRKVLRWTFDNNAANPLDQGIYLSGHKKLEKVITSQSFEEYLQAEFTAGTQRDMISKLAHLSPDNYPEDLESQLKIGHVNKK